jgi:hypothetical protein
MRRVDGLRRRGGFTLVELLVSAALIMFIMYILSEAFGAASKTFRDLKGIGDMNRRLRIAATFLRRDLAADHFEGKKRLSDPNFWESGPPRAGYFRVYQDTNPANGDPVDEGADLDSIHSFRSVHQILQFSVKYRGNTRENFMLADVPTSSPAPLAPTSQGADSRYEDSLFAGTSPALYQYRSPWAEVAYFLRPEFDVNGNQDAGNGQPLYTLYRRQWLLVNDNASLDPAQAVSVTTGTNQNIRDYLEVSAMPDPAAPTTFLYFNGPIDITEPARRMGTTTTGLPKASFASASPYKSIPTLKEDSVTYNANPQIGGADLLVNDVVSFDVRVLLTTGTDFVSIDDASVQAFATAGHPTFNGTTGPFVFDTWSSQHDNVYDYSGWYTNYANVPITNAIAPQQPSPTVNTIPLFRNSAGGLIGIRAIQVTIRIWDIKTEQTRQVTIVQDL